MNETQQRTASVQDLLHPDTPRPKVVQALPDDRQDALGDSPLRVGALHPVLHEKPRFRLNTHTEDTELMRGDRSSSVTTGLAITIFTFKPLMLSRSRNMSRSQPSFPNPFTDEPNGLMVHSGK